MLIAIPLPAHAVGSKVAIQVSLTRDYEVTVTGQLTTADGQGIVGELMVSIGEVQVQRTRSSADGEFEFQFVLHEIHQSGKQTLTVAFEGKGNAEPASATAILSLGDGAPAQGAGVTLTAQVDPASAAPGDLVSINGTVATAGGDPVRQAEVDVTIGGTALPDSTTFTNDDGSFATYAEVPLDLPPGSVEVTLTSPATASLGAGSLAVEFAVKAAPQVEASPGASPSPEASPSGDPSAQASASSTDPEAAPSEDTTTARVDENLVNPFEWLLVAVIAVGGVSLLVVLGLLIRRRTRRQPPAEDADLLGLSSDPDWGGGDPEGDDLLSEDPAPSPAPRRGM
ncbi:MAG: hypothetical protein ACK5KO_07130 [Arachnia sp.]